MALLNHLNNVDKHRYLHPGFAGVAIQLPHDAIGRIPIILGRPFAMYVPPGVGFTAVGMGIPQSPDGSVVADKGWSFRGSDNDPTEIARVLDITIKPGAEPKMEMQPPPILEVSFSDRERPVTIFDLRPVIG